MPSQSVKGRLQDFKVRLAMFIRFNLRMRGKTPRECPVCGYKGLFRYYGAPPRRDAECPECKCLERHRLLKVWTDRSSDAVKGTRALHFAPEKSVMGFIRNLPREYITCDIVPGAADVVRNLESIDEPDESFDLVICSHVLEHVDDKKALKELRRILRPSGAVILMVPIIEAWATTYENPQATSPDDRELYFGQWDHVRYYGRDLRDRIRAAGFELSEFTAMEPDVSRFSLTRGETVFVAKRA
jgi:SAM-dependent methyltransferase